MIWFIVIGLIVFGLLQWNSKIEFYQMRNGKKKLVAEVQEYRYEKSPMRNDYTQIAYPYVKIDNNEEDDWELIRLKYANSIKKPFKIGDTVEVFWYGGILYYWNAYDKGLMKLFPNKWIFWQ